jgi:hypothetical protein
MDKESAPFSEISRTAASIISWWVSAKHFRRRGTPGLVEGGAMASGDDMRAAVYDTPVEITTVLS